MDVSIRLEGKNKEVNIENAAVTELIMLMDSIADEVGLASFNDETQVQALTRYIEKLKELQTIVKSIKETNKSASEQAAFSEPLITGAEIKEAMRIAIDDFAYNVIPEDSAENVADRERYNTVISPKVGGGGKDFQEIAEKHILYDTGEYKPYAAVQQAAKVICEYMYKRSKA